MMQTWWSRPVLYARANEHFMPGPILLFTNSRLLHRVRMLCCLELSVFRSMVVSFGAPCSRTLLISYMLLIMMLLDSCCMNHDGVVHLDFVHLLMFRHLLPWCVNWCTHFWVHYVSVTTLIYVMMNSYIYFRSPCTEYIVLIVLYPFFFSFFYLFVLFYFLVCMSSEPAIE